MMSIDLVCTSPFGCTNKNVKHETDTFKTLHGSPDQPTPVADVAPGKYVAWEYEEVGRKVGVFHRCMQQLFEDSEKTPRFSMDRIVVRDIRGDHHVFYFDISVPINADRLRIEQAYKDYLAGKPIDPDLKKSIEKAIAVQKKNSRVVEL